MFGKILVLRILGKVAKVPNLVPLLKQLYLRNFRSKSKSDLIFIKTKVQMMFRVPFVFLYFHPFTWQIAFEYRQKRCHFSMVFHISRKISSLIFSRNTLKSCSITSGTILRKLHVRQNSRSGVMVPKFGKMW